MAKGKYQQKKMQSSEEALAKYNPILDENAWINAYKNNKHVQSTFPTGMTVNRSFGKDGITMGPFVILLGEKEVEIYLGPPEYKQQIGKEETPEDALNAIYLFAIFAPKNILSRIEKMTEGVTCKLSDLKSSESKAVFAWSLSSLPPEGFTLLMEEEHVGYYWVPESLSRFKHLEGRPVNYIEV